LRKPGLPAWAVTATGHRHNLICSSNREDDLEAHNRHLNAKYACITAREQRSDCYHCEDANVLVVACNTPARMAKGAIEAAGPTASRPASSADHALAVPRRSPQGIAPADHRLVIVEGSPASWRTNCASRSATRTSSRHDLLGEALRRCAAVTGRDSRLHRETQEVLS